MQRFFEYLGYVRAKFPLLVRFIKFSIVGGSGVVVNLGSLYLLVEFAKLPKVIAGAIAIELSIINNFYWNNLWTWSDRRKESWWVKLIKYNLVMGVSALANYVVFLALYHLGLNYLLADATGIAVAVLINFFFSDKWVFLE